MAQRELAKLVTFEEFENFTSRPENQDRHFELIDGEIVEKAMPTQLHGRITTRFIMRLGLFVENNQLGYIENEVRYRLPGDKHNARQPDISFFADLDTPVVQKGPVPRMPDLVVEVKSPDDNFNQMRAKAAYYLANGTRLVWLVYTEKRLIVVLVKDGEDILTMDDTLDGGEVLPGFTLPVKDLFPV